MAYQKPSFTDKVLYRIVSGKKLRTPKSSKLEYLHPAVAFGKSKYGPKKKKKHLTHSKKYRTYKRKKSRGK